MSIFNSLKYLIGICYKSVKRIFDKRKKKNTYVYVV